MADADQDAYFEEPPYNSHSRLSDRWAYRSSYSVRRKYISSKHWRLDSRYLAHVRSPSQPLRRNTRALQMGVPIHHSKNPVVISFFRTGTAIGKVTMLPFTHPVFQSPTASIPHGSPSLEMSMLFRIPTRNTSRPDLHLWTMSQNQNDSRRFTRVTNSYPVVRIESLGSPERRWDWN